MNNNQLPDLSNVAEQKGVNDKTHLLMRPKFRIVPAQKPSTTGRENKTSTSSAGHIRYKPPRMRHHNPGTKYRPDPRLYRRPEKRVQMLSSIIVVPPKMTQFPTNRCKPSSSCGAQATDSFRRPLITEIEPKWKKPKEYETSPPRSAWKQTRSLVPVPQVDYRYGFNVVPGKAYQTVLRYENRDAVWPPKKTDLPETPRPHFHDASGRDPRTLDLRIRLNKLKLTDLREHLHKKRAALNPTKETPEQAVARIHGETSEIAQTTQPGAAAPPTTRPSSRRNNDDPWPTPGRRRRRCRLVIVYDKPESSEGPK